MTTGFPTPFPAMSHAVEALPYTVEFSTARRSSSKYGVGRRYRPPDLREEFARRRRGCLKYVG